jgi:hypothetical protein
MSICHSLDQEIVPVHRWTLSFVTLDCHSSSTCHAKEKRGKSSGIIDSIFLNAQNIAGQTEVLVPFRATGKPVATFI